MLNRRDCLKGLFALPVPFLFDHKNRISFTPPENERWKYDFGYFAENYLKVYHPTRSVLPLKMYPFQRRLIQTYEDNQLTILTKFRCGGFTTVTAAWCLWKALAHKNQNIMFVCPRRCDADCVADLFGRTISYMPEDVRPELKKESREVFEFASTGSRIYFTSSNRQTFRGHKLTHCVLDEAAFARRMDHCWTCLIPSLQNAKVIAISTTNGIGNWFEETYHRALGGENRFKVFKSHYTEHPVYQNSEHVEMLKKDLGPAGWAQDVEQMFVYPDYEGLAV